MINDEDAENPPKPNANINLNSILGTTNSFNCQNRKMKNRFFDWGKSPFWFFWFAQKQKKTREKLFSILLQYFFLLFAADPEISVSGTVDENCYLYKTIDTTGYPHIWGNLHLKRSVNGVKSGKATCEKRATYVAGGCGCCSS